VELGNADRVYDYYEHHRQSRVYARLMHVVFARVYNADITCDPGAEAAIAEALDQGGRIIISPNHTTADDQYVVVSLAQKLRALHPLRGAAFIPAEPSLFTRPGVAGLLLRRAVDGLGALPTFRLEDLRRSGLEHDEQANELHRRSMVRASEVQVAKLIGGESMAGFWEGTRNRTDYRIVQPLKKGIAHTAIAAAATVPVLLLPVGIYYGAEPEDYRRPVVPGRHKPVVHVGAPIPVHTDSAEELTTLLHPAIQRCVDHAVARCTARVHTH
jgi:1-acyl-sn-glycerol-3-phosphate acyltransferase